MLESDMEDGLQIEQWVECVLNDTSPLVLPEETFVSMKILDAVYRSSETGKTVYFKENCEEKFA